MNAAKKVELNLIAIYFYVNLYHNQEILEYEYENENEMLGYAIIF